mgnify:CR=1 FL=1
MTRAQKGGGKGVAKTVMSHWLTYSTGGSPNSDRCAPNSGSRQLSSSSKVASSACGVWGLEGWLGLGGGMDRLVCWGLRGCQMYGTVGDGHVTTCQITSDGPCDEHTYQQIPCQSSTAMLATPPHYPALARLPLPSPPLPPPAPPPCPPLPPSFPTLSGSSPGRYRRRRLGPSPSISRQNSLDRRVHVRRGLHTCTH